MPRDSIAGFPFFALAFDKNAKPTPPHEAEELAAAARPDGPTDLFVMSHGWNNDLEQSRALYERVFAQVRQALDGGVVPKLKDRRFALAGVFWPSMKFADRDLIPGGAAAAADSLAAEIRDAIAIADKADVPRLRAIAEGLRNPALRKKAVRAMRRLVASVPSDKGEPEVSRESLEELSDEAFLRLLSGATAPAPMEDEVGGVAGLGGALSGFPEGVRSALGFWTFWSMKKRAGAIGAEGLSPALDRVRKANGDLRIHLAGHSFGARLVTAAADAGDFAPSTMTLLQAAFSHNAFSPKGAFRKVLTGKKVRGPILITHSARDVPVGIAYPIAVRLSFDSTSTLGTKHDKYGGLGRNGAQKTEEAKDLVLHGPPKKYAFNPPSLVFNLQGDSIILGHGDIAKPEIAFAMLSAIAAAK
jgi:hypothetical protein